MPDAAFGQTVECRLEAEAAMPPSGFTQVFTTKRELKQIRGEAREVAFGKETLLSWRVPIPAHIRSRN